MQGHTTLKEEDYLIFSLQNSKGATNNRYAEQVLAKQMDPAVVKEIKALEAAGKYEDPRYFELLLPHY